jgi:hypothetical protein
VICKHQGEGQLAEELTARDTAFAWLASHGRENRLADGLETGAISGNGLNTVTCVCLTGAARMRRGGRRAYP